jgi:hypothetical protein
MWPSIFQDMSVPFVLPEENSVALHKITFNQGFEGWQQKETSSSNWGQTIGII